MSPLDELITWNRGLHVRGTPLWIDPDQKRELVCLTAPPGRKLAAHVRTLASPGIAAALERQGNRAPVLPAEFGRWIGIGGVQLQTVDLGLAPEGEELASAVLVAVGGRRLLFTGALRRQDSRWPAAEHVVVRLVAPGHRGGELHQVLRGVTTFARQAHTDGVPATLLVDAMDLAGVLLRELSGLRGIGVTLGGRLSRVLGPHGASKPAAEGPSLTLRLSGDRVPSRGRLARIDTGLPRAGQGRAPDATFRLKWFADPEAVARLARVTRATGMTLLGASQTLLAVVGEQVGPAVSLRVLGQPLQLDLGAPEGPAKLRV